MEVKAILYEDESDIPNHVGDFYEKFYKEPKSWRPTIDSLDCACLEKTKRLSLKKEFENEEILEAI